MMLAFFYFFFRNYVYLDGSPIDKQGEDSMKSDDFKSMAFSPATNDLELALIDRFLVPGNGPSFRLWRHLDISETSAATRACCEFFLWNIAWVLVANAKKWRLYRNIIAFFLSIGKQ